MEFLVCSCCAHLLIKGILCYFQQILESFLSRGSCRECEHCEAGATIYMRTEHDEGQNKQRFNREVPDKKRS